MSDYRTQSPEALQARKEQAQLILAHQSFAARFAWRACRITGRKAEFDDVMSEAMLGLAEAARRFRPELGHRFTTYAAFWMKRTVYQYINETSRAVRPPIDSDTREARAKLSRATQALGHRLFREPTSEEIAAEIGAERSVVDRAMVAFRKDMAVSHGGEVEPGHYTPSADADQFEAVSGALDQRRKALAICRALTMLSPREADVIRRHYYADEPETLAEIGASYGLTRERARQIEAAAMPRFKALLVAQLGEEETVRRAG